VVRDGFSSSGSSAARPAPGRPLTARPRTCSCCGSRTKTTLNYYITGWCPQGEAAPADLAYVDGIDEGFVLTRRGSDGRMHAMGFTPRARSSSSRDLRQEAAGPHRVGELLRQQLEKA
jgi:hypothetical protein